MTKQEIADVTAMAFGKTDLSDVDDSVLHDLYLPSFQAPVYTTTIVVARMMRDICRYLNGGTDTEALNEFCQVAKKKIRIIG